MADPAYLGEAGVRERVRRLSERRFNMGRWLAHIDLAVAPADPSA
jgi:hypothetical protein